MACSNMEPMCCGQTTPNGECLGHCAVPMQCEGCDECDPTPMRQNFIEQDTGDVTDAE